MGIDKKIIKEIRKEVKYWNNVDFRYVGLPHMSNHLNFLIYHYSLIFPKSMWPKKLVCGNMMLKDGVKISKSKGNGIPLYRIKKMYGADLYRLSIATNSNYDVEMDFCDDDITQLKKKFDRFVEVSNNSINKRKENLNEIDKWLICKFYLNVKKYFIEMKNFKIREAYVELFYETLKDFTYFSRRTNEKNLYEVVNYFLKDFLILMTPTIPHICEEIFSKIEKNKFISMEKFETNYENKIDKNILQKEEIISNLLQKILSENNKKEIKIIQATTEKFDLFFEIKSLLELKKNPKEIFGNLNKKFPSQNKFIKKFVPKCFKDGISFFMNKEDEEKFLLENISFLEKESGCKIKIIEEENSTSNPSDFKIIFE